MNFKRKGLLLKTVVLLAIVGILAVTVFLLSNHKKYNPSSKDLRPTSKLAYAKGISFTEYHGEKRVYSVSIDNFSVERARLGPFAIGPFRVAHFNKVNVDLFLDGMEARQDDLKKDKRMEEDLPDFENPISNIKRNLPPQLNRIRGFKFKDLSFNLWKNGDRIFRVSSDTAEFDQKTQDLIFAGHAMIDSGKNGTLLSYRIRWNYKTRLFSATGPYILTKDGENKEGTGIEIDYLFRRINFHPPKE